MTLVKISARDGSQVEFINKNPKSGKMKEVYFAPDHSYVVAFYKTMPDANRMECLEEIVGTYRQRIIKGRSGNYWRDLFRWPEKLVDYQGRVGLVVPSFHSDFFFSDEQGEKREKTGDWFALPKNFNRHSQEVKGNLGKFIAVCLRLSRAVRRLHAEGLSHSDLSYRNCLIDPKGGKACIIDIDGLVVPQKYPPEVLGSMDFIAPEVLATAHLPNIDSRRRWPCLSTDLHALAVLIYLFALHRHPLRGGQYLSDDADEDENLMMGGKALFIEHPTNTSNRPILTAEDTPRLPWVDSSTLPYRTMGPYLSPLFERAFIDGLHDPEKRPRAHDWEDALEKTTDLLQPCSNLTCDKKFYIFDATTQPKCPYCGTSFVGSIPMLELYYHTDRGLQPENHRIMVYKDMSFFLWHVYQNLSPNENLDDTQRQRIGYFTFHMDCWLFVNEALATCKDLGVGDQPLNPSRGNVINIGSHIKLLPNQWLLLSPEEKGRLVRVKLLNH